MIHSIKLRRLLLVIFPIISLLGAVVVLVVPRDSHADAANFPTQYFAPYVDTTVAGDPFATTGIITNASRGAGTRYYTLSSIDTATDTCNPTWNTGATMGYMQNEINTLRANSAGDVVVSFGGSNADSPKTHPSSYTDLALSCPDATSLQAAYQQVINQYQLTHIDFDIEGDELEDPAYAATVHLRNQAIAGLQSGVSGQPLSITYSLPITTAGLDQSGLKVLSDAINTNVPIACVNILAKDFGSAADPTQMGQNTLTAANATYQNLQGLYPQKTTPAQLWGMLGITPMIGWNDIGGTTAAGQTQRESFTLDDAQTVINFAMTNKLHMLSMINLNRDQQPATVPPIIDTTTPVSNTNSGIEETPDAFATLFNTFTGSQNPTPLASPKGTATAPLWSGDATLKSKTWQTAWGVQAGNSFGIGTNLTLTSDPTGKFKGNVFKVTYPAGSGNDLSQMPGGGQFEAHPKGFKLPKTMHDTLYLRYYVLFPQGFDFGAGGMLPGIYAGTGPFSAGNKPTSDAQGFSARAMWRTENPATPTIATSPHGEMYAYMATPPTMTQAQTFQIYNDPQGGTDLENSNLNAWPFNGDAQWHAIQEEIHLNTPGQTDGAIHAWLDDQDVLDATGLTFRQLNDLTFTQAGLFFSTFFDGSTANPGPQTAVTAYFAGFALSDQYIAPDTNLMTNLVTVPLTQSCPTCTPTTPTTTTATTCVCPAGSTTCTLATGQTCTCTTANQVTTCIPGGQTGNNVCTCPAGSTTCTLATGQTCTCTTAGQLITCTTTAQPANNTCTCPAGSTTCTLATGQTCTCTTTGQLITCTTTAQPANNTCTCPAGSTTCTLATGQTCTCTTAGQLITCTTTGGQTGNNVCTCPAGSTTCTLATGQACNCTTTGQLITCTIGQTTPTMNDQPCKTMPGATTTQFSSSGLSIQIAKDKNSLTVGNTINYSVTVCDSPITSATVGTNNQIVVTAMLSSGLSNISAGTNNTNWHITLTATSSPTWITAIYTGTTPLTPGNALPTIMFSGLVTQNAVPHLTTFASVDISGNPHTNWPISVDTVTVKPVAATPLVTLPNPLTALAPLTFWSQSAAGGKKLHRSKQAHATHAPPGIHA